MRLLSGSEFLYDLVHITADSLDVVEDTYMVIHERCRLRLGDLQLRDLLTSLVALINLLLKLVEALRERLVLLGDCLNFLLEAGLLLHEVLGHLGECHSLDLVILLLLALHGIFAPGLPLGRRRVTRS